MPTINGNGKADSSFNYVFPAIRGIQAGREYYIAMCPLKLVPKIFTLDDGDIPATLRAQRNLNKSRVPEITKYIVELNGHPTDRLAHNLNIYIKGVENKA